MATATTIPLKVPPAARKIAKEVLAVRATLPPSRRAGTPVGLATANALAYNTDDAFTHAAIRRFWPRWAMKYRVLKAQGRTATNSKLVQAGDLWGGIPMLEVVEREKASVRRVAAGAIGRIAKRGGAL